MVQPKMTARNATALIAAVLAIAGPARADLEVSTRPNIVIVLADDLGYSDLGCYGGEIRTPRLDGLAAGGVRFTQFYNTARCWPTRASVLTGYYAQQVRRDVVPGVKSGSNGTRPGWAKLLPQRLRPLGRSFRVKLWPNLVFLRDGRVMKQLARPRVQEVREGLEAIA